MAERPFFSMFTHKAVSFGVVRILRPLCFAFAWTTMCQWQIMARAVTWWNVLRVQNTSSAGQHKATSPGCFARPLLFAPGQVIDVHPRPEGKREPCMQWRATCPFSRSQGREVWRQLRASGTVPQKCAGSSPWIPSSSFFYLLRIPSPLGSFPGFPLARTMAHLWVLMHS